ncbi:Sensory transduction protein LytR [Pseudoalteromonas sp. THAF3]|uniref:LytR/AlgR family response regulator transcription factor n=1 Tax=Pseudoalteromonas TaxID=53246 RepID=UPI00034C65E6|nr:MULTISPECIES: LytTR family DNA-binding domain-containing protein [Pseudoalteromonas]MCF2861556.1 LytTR family DNA-binding domain-containing protein [Pseudoalteromonas sp. CNAT2-18]MCG7542676.1 LytTR family DNA-binding domain-containing protein [Pseudoalteromonas sp. MM17-2]MCG7557406.1 LytTR family DNA-binding domain-containing protein [Pseudoalteromonas sp. CNAT2-18.1]MCG7564997.1 LytTR family DNA-binding domain-containing protein [Pseudoalteromonas sp. CnMc7-15]MCG7568684.1 LytTR family D|tara:strand:+ start:4352 stop:5179 length:828 start_codon:yes stop_codon:yes gene_type:complete
MNTIKTLIVDDESLARKGLAIRLADIECIELVQQCAQGQEAVDICRSEPIDLVFLDIQMPGMNGFEVADALAQLPDSQQPLVVFVTAFDRYAVQAFEVHALDYVLKPVDDNRLKQAVEKVQSHLKTQQDNTHKKKLASFVAGITGNNCEEILKKLASGDSLETKRYPESLAVKEQGEIIRVPTNTIQWVDAAGDYMCLHCGDGQTHILRKTMKELEQELDPGLFVRVHRSAIVNSKQINKLVTQVSGEYLLVLTNGQELKVSRSYRDKVKAALAN